MRFASKKPFLVIAAACLALAPWPAFLALQKQADAYEAQRQSIQSQLAPLQGRQGAILENAETAKALSDSIACIARSPWMSSTNLTVRPSSRCNSLA